jgi:glycerol uptake facilitator-like aquaporin
MASSDTTFTKKSVQVWFCVPLCLIAVCKAFNLGLGTNPAQAIAFQVAYYALSPADPHPVKVIQLQRIWSVIVGATLGGLVAGIIFEFIYRPYAKAYRNEQI